MESGLEEGTLKLVTTIDSGRLNFTRGGGGRAAGSVYIET